MTAQGLVKEYEYIYIIFRQCYTCILILGIFQVTTKQQVLGINAITSLLYNPTKITHDSKFTLYHSPFSNSTCFILSLI